jgi:chromosome segregation ATPase
MFDEIDAHLDAENVFKFVSAFGKSSRMKQIVFVSHKPFVFKNADVLLGITKSQSDNSATCFSFNNEFWQQQKKQR